MPCPSAAPLHGDDALLPLSWHQAAGNNDYIRDWTSIIPSSLMVDLLEISPPIIE